MRSAPFLLVLIFTLSCGGAGKGPPAPGYAGDTDRDGVKDSDETAGCVGKVEDIDGFLDADGCPDEDNDKDGMVDTADACPGVPSKGDPSGCPDVDNSRVAAANTSADSDGDGIIDIIDSCLNDPEDKDGFADSDGCPDPDNDNDGVADASDRCNGKAQYPTTWREDGRGRNPADGCMAEDRDGDLVIDDEDECPTTTGLAIAKGCPSCIGQWRGSAGQPGEVVSLRVDLRTGNCGAWKAPGCDATLSNCQDGSTFTANFSCKINNQPVSGTVTLGCTTNSSNVNVNLIVAGSPQPLPPFAVTRQR